jgi:nitrite reductase/ring-hydroxylating ferredoxin subunit
MDLPAAVAALGARLDDNAELLPDPELFRAPEVFAAERERIFLRSSVAIDHASRIAENGRYFRCDAALGSILLTRDAEGALHALRNVCLHAGYPICEAEEGEGERLICPYHGWEYALDGRLVEPELSARLDPARLKLKHYAVGIEDGLIVVDPGGAPGLRRPAGRILPAWLADATVSRRARWSAAWNWKLALQFVKASPRLFLDDVGADLAWQALSPISLILAGRNRAALLQVIPKGAGHTLLRLVAMTAPGAPPAGAAAEDRVGESLAAGGGPPVRLDRAFFAWYRSLMSAD